MSDCLPSPVFRHLLKAASLVALPSAAFFFGRRFLLSWKAENECKSEPEIPLYGAQPALLERFLYIPQQFVGIVLGRYQRNLRRVEFETRTFLTLISYNREEFEKNPMVQTAFDEWNNENEEDISDEENTWSFIRIHAQNEYQIELVSLAVRAAIADSKNRRSEIEMRVPGEAVGFIIGRRGENIRRVMQECRVHVNIDQNSEEFEKVTIQGSPEGIKRAQEKILMAVDKYARLAGINREMTAEEEMAIMRDEELAKILEDDTPLG